MFPPTGRILCRDFPDHGSIRGSRDRLHVGLAPRPSAARQLSIFGVPSERNSSPPIGEKPRLQTTDLRRKIGAVVRLHVNFLALVLQLADFAPERANLLNVLHGSAAAAVGE